MSYAKTWEVLKSATVSAAATADIDLSTFYNIYEAFEIELYHCYPATDNTNLWMRVSADGSTYDAGGSDYTWTEQYALDNTASGGNGATAAFGLITGGQANTQANAGNHIIHMTGLSNANYKQRIITLNVWSKAAGNGGNTITNRVGITRTTAQITKAVRFLYSSGNINCEYIVRGCLK